VELKKKTEAETVKFQVLQLKNTIIRHGDDTSAQTKMPRQRTHVQGYIDRDEGHGTRTPLFTGNKNHPILSSRVASKI